MAEKGGKRENAGRKVIGTVINTRIENELLHAIEEEIVGKNRADKIRNCIRLGLRRKSPAIDEKKENNNNAILSFSKSYKLIYGLLEAETMVGIKKLNEVIEKCFFVDTEKDQTMLKEDRILACLEGYPQEIQDKIVRELSKYVWRMDEKTVGSKVVTPHVLGYVFEQVINQKEKGAYYTSEDTTDYISENTILLSIINKSVNSKNLEYTMVKKARFNSNAYSKNNNDNITEIKVLDDLISNNFNLVRLFLDSLNDMDQIIREEVVNCIVNLKIIDPTVGTGAFIVAAIRVLLEVFEGIDVLYPQKTRNQYIKHIFQENIYGVDIMPDAIEILKLRIKLLLRHFGLNEHEINDINLNFRVGNTIFGNCNNLMNNYECIYNANNLQMNYEQWKIIAKPFDWNEEFAEIMNNGGFDCVIGNPPYVEEKKSLFMYYNDYSFKTAGAGNLYAYVIERSFQITSSKGVVGLIVPISLVATPRMSRVRKCIIDKTEKCWISSFADRPASLFAGVHQKLNIFIAMKGNVSKSKVYTSDYLHWTHKERNMLFNNLHFTENSYFDDYDVFLKVGNNIQKSIIKKMLIHKRNLSEYLNQKYGNYSIHLNMRMTFWCKCFLEGKSSNEYKTFYFEDSDTAYILNALFNSSFFFMLWEAVSDCWHITNKDFEFVKFDINSIHEKTRKDLVRLSKELEKDLEKNKEFIGSKQTDYVYQHKKSKFIIDEIDYLLAKCYGFTKEELSYILNYNLEYRMSDELSNYLKGEKRCEE